MREDQFHKLQPGDIVRLRGTGEGHMVTGNYGDFFIAVRVLVGSNPEEWELVKKADRAKGEYDG